MVAKRRTPDDWDLTLGTMVDRGARRPEAEQHQVYNDLVKYFVADKPAAKAPAP